MAFIFGIILRMFKTKEYLVPGSEKAVLFLAPYTTSLSSMAWPIRQMNKQGYSVIGYEFTNEVFKRGNPQDLISLVEKVCTHLQETVDQLHSDGYSYYAIVGASIGSFVAYNFLSKASDWSWAILIAGGNAADAVWNYKSERKYFEKMGSEKTDLSKAWTEIQHPNFDNIAGKKVLMVSSRSDRITEYDGALDALNHLRKSKVDVEMITQKKLGHSLMLLRNLASIKKHLVSIEQQ